MPPLRGSVVIFLNYFYNTFIPSGLWYLPLLSVFRCGNVFMNVFPAKHIPSLILKSTILAMCHPSGVQDCFVANRCYKIVHPFGIIAPGIICNFLALKIFSGTVFHKSYFFTNLLFRQSLLQYFHPFGINKLRRYLCF